MPYRSTTEERVTAPGLPVLDWSLQYRQHGWEYNEIRKRGLRSLRVEVRRAYDVDYCYARVSLWCVGQGWREITTRPLDNASLKITWGRMSNEEFAERGYLDAMRDIANQMFEIGMSFTP